MSKTIVFFLTLSSFAFADCPKNSDEYQKLAPQFIIKLAAKKSEGETTDFGGMIGKTASAGTVSFIVGSETWYFVKADHKSENVSGVVKCDSERNKLVAMSLGWANGKKGSGVMGGPID